MVNLQDYLNKRGLQSIDAVTIRAAIRKELNTTELAGLLPASEIRKALYKPPGGLQTAMDELTDHMRDTLKAYSIPGDVFNSVVKMIISSDASDAKQKLKRAAAAHDLKMQKLTLALETQKIDHATAKSVYQAAQIAQESAAVLRSTNKANYQASKTIEKTELLHFDQAFITLESACTDQSTAETQNATAVTNQSTAVANQSTAVANQSTAVTNQSTAVTNQSTAEVENAISKLHYSTAAMDETATSHRHEAEGRIHELDLLIKQEQLAEARARSAEARAKSALAIHNLEEAMGSGQVVGSGREKPIRFATFPVLKSSLLAKAPIRPGANGEKKSVKFSADVPEGK